MKIAIAGIGAVGGYFGGRLAAAGVDTVFIARGKTLEALRSRGLRVDSINGDFFIDDAHATDKPSEVGVVDAIIFSTKAWQTPDAAEQVKPMVGPHTIAVPLQNGMDGPDQLSRAFGREHALGGLCGIVAFSAAPAHIRHVGIDPFVMFGELDNSKSERVERLQKVFAGAGVKAEVPQDIHRSMWSKFLFIAPMSAVGALTRVPVGVWRTIPETRDIVVRALREMVAVAAARGVDVGADAVDRTLERYDGMPPDSTSSLQRDVMEGKPSELEAQAGAIVRMARESGVQTPVCDQLYGLLLPQERKVRANMARS